MVGVKYHNQMSRVRVHENESKGLLASSNSCTEMNQKVFLRVLLIKHKENRS